jgi:predicted RNase H-like HicB family nuclease
MAMLIGLIHGSAGAWGISFPDLPGCIGGGATMDAAMASGRESAALHLDALVDDGLPLPPFRTVDQLRTDPAFAEDFADAEAVTALDIELPGRAVRLNITMDEGLLQRIDRRAAELGESRSGFLAAARARMQA